MACVRQLSASLPTVISHQLIRSSHAPLPPPLGGGGEGGGGDGGGGDGGGSDGGGGESDVLVCELPADCPQARARLVKALRAPSAPYHLVLAADYARVKADGELAGLLLRSPGALFVVPKAPTSSGQVGASPEP